MIRKHNIDFITFSILYVNKLFTKKFWTALQVIAARVTESLPLICFINPKFTI